MTDRANDIHRDQQQRVMRTLIHIFNLSAEWTTLLLRTCRTHVYLVLFACSISVLCLSLLWSAACSHVHFCVLICCSLATLCSGICWDVAHRARSAPSCMHAFRLRLFTSSVFFVLQFRQRGVLSPNFSASELLLQWLNTLRRFHVDDTSRHVLSDDYVVSILQVSTASCAW